MTASIDAFYSDKRKVREYYRDSDGKRKSRIVTINANEHTGETYKEWLKKQQKSVTPSGYKLPDSWKKSDKVSNTIAEDLKNTNPNFMKSDGYKINCTKAVATYEMRRRGYDVEAMPFKCEGWKHIFKNFKFEEDLSNISNENVKQHISDYLLKSGNGTRVEIQFLWEDENTPKSHVFVGECDAGKVLFLDPQQNDMDASYIFEDKKIINGSFKYAKISDKEITEIIKECCECKR